MIGGDSLIPQPSVAGVASAIYPDQSLRAGLGLSTSLLLAIVITIGGLYLAARRLEAFSLTGDPA